MNKVPSSWRGALLNWSVCIGVIVISELLTSVVLGATPLYGDDILTAMSNQLGFEVRLQACSAAKGEVKVAILSGGQILYDGKPKPVGDVAQVIHGNRLDINTICLYVEGPMSSASHSAFRQIMTSVASNNIGVVRFTDRDFVSRVIPNVPRPSSAK